MSKGRVPMPTQVLLAKRCEKEGPSRELDRAIHVAVYPEYPPKPGVIHLLYYTTSLDDAMTLKPDGAELEFSTLYHIARAVCPLNGDDPQTAGRQDMNIPMTLCAVFLKARANTTMAAAKERKWHSI